MTNDNKQKHLEMIQGIINRMANNSFMLKGWAVTLVASIFALSSKDAKLVFFLMEYVPIVLFWGLDSYYLAQERRYRELYDKVCSLSDEKIDFKMSAPQVTFGKFLSCLMSKTEWIFYIPLAFLTAIVIKFAI